ncbi:hypothetical protein JHL18_16985 [Clostridium sp. YIM B02505]|uniref:Uncharacterized protein n=1 Tax=Clostridium yunnanense TaxID=2800325 RepID=A0ABS1ESH8_9CLOT|nr:hypothetical protein [Clostridium yunnanense]MBK1812321.1 hypothetical protein [Clostridium yunnanense]
MSNLIFSYLVYIVYFLGMGLVSSGIVLMPFNIMRYSAILLTGLILFISGTIFNEIVINKKKLSFVEITKLIIVSLSLAIGIGMISGGISHFKESPRYVSYLIPTGIIISLISFTIKNNYKLNKQSKIILAIAVLIIAVVVHSSLSYFASSMLGNGGDIFNNMNNMDNMH